MVQIGVDVGLIPPALPLLLADATVAAAVIAGATVAVVLPLLTVVLFYNRLTTLRLRVRNAYSQIDVQLRRRYDLIPNLVNAVQGAMRHERQTLEEVVAARAAATQAANAAAAAPGAAVMMEALGRANVTLDRAVGRLLGLTEAYPDLKTSTNVLQLQEELVSTENRVAFARQAYNDGVMLYNKPGMLPASALDQLIAAARAVDMAAVKRHLERANAANA